MKISRWVTLLVGVALASTVAFGAGGIARGVPAPRTAATLVVALPPGQVPTSVFPFASAGQCTTVNTSFWDLTARPGYWFGLGASVALQPSLSPLDLPTFATAGPDTTVTFDVKGWVWSNGSGGTETMTAQDVAFFLNMDKAQAQQGDNAACGYEPGYGIPDQVVSVSYPGGLSGDQVQIVFAGHPDEQWLLNNELSQIVPLARAWDTTGPGFAGCSTEAFAAVTEAGSDLCSKVFTYLSSLNIGDPLWKWSDGPYREATVEGAAVPNYQQVANVQYSGPVKAQAVKSIVYRTYGTTGAEMAALKGSHLDLGYADPTELSRALRPGVAGRNLSAGLKEYAPSVSTTFGVNYWALNFDNSHSTYETSGKMPTWADLINLQYFREAMQASVDEPALISQVFNGYATQTFSAIPSYPKTAYGVANTYAYNPAKARALMASHGWDTKKFPDVCAVRNCGSSAFPVPRGTKASLAVQLLVGDLAVVAQAQAEVATFKKASGIQLVTSVSPIDTVQPSCWKWEVCAAGGWIYAPDFYPSGEGLFATGTYWNSGGYDSAEMNALIAATTTGTGLALNQKDPTFATSYAQFTETDVPYLWQPVPESVVEQIKTLRGEQRPNPLGNFNPEYITQI